MAIIALLSGAKVVCITGTKIYQVYTGYNSIQDGWQICTNPDLSIIHRIGGGRQDILGSNDY